MKSQTDPQKKAFLNPDLLQYFSIDEASRFLDTNRRVVGEDDWIKEVIRREEEVTGSDFTDLVFDDIDPDDWHAAS